MGNGITEETVNTEIVPFKHVAEETGDGLKEGRVVCHVIIIIVNQRTKPFALEAVPIVDLAAPMVHGPSMPRSPCPWSW